MVGAEACGRVGDVWRARVGAARGRVDWVGSIAAARGRPRRDGLKHRAVAQEALVVAVDASTSMLRGGGMARAKGIALALERAARASGAEVGLVWARGGEAAVSVGGVARATRAATAGGGTSLRVALMRARELVLRGEARRRSVVLLTDGRSRESLADVGRAFVRGGVEVTIVDCERRAVRLGRCRDVARALGARVASVGDLGLKHQRRSS